MQQRSGAVVPAAATARRRCEGTAMGSITLDLRPGLGIGPFTIGMDQSLTLFSLTLFVAILIK